MAHTSGSEVPDRRWGPPYDRRVVPSWLLWLLPPVLAPMVALLWASWTSRTRTPADPFDTVAAYERFRALLSPDRAFVPRQREEP